MPIGIISKNKSCLIFEDGAIEGDRELSEKLSSETQLLIRAIKKVNKNPIIKEVTIILRGYNYAKS